MNPLDNVLGRLKNASRSGNGYRAPCPCHDDDKPSLGLCEGENGKVLIICRAGCSTESILQRLGLEWADLFPAEHRGKGKGGCRPPVPAPRRSTTENKPPRPSAFWQKGQAELTMPSLRVHRNRMAKNLGSAVTVEAMDRVGVGYSEPFAWYPEELTWPERAGNRDIIGIGCRQPDGCKMMCPGSQRGLIIPDGVIEGSGPLYLPEGMTDTLALLSCGLDAIGRPSNTGGVEHLARLLQDVPPGRSIIVLGERDRKPDGAWPGRDGARRTVRELSAALGRIIRWALPPGGAKDAREWFEKQPKGMDGEATVRLWTAGLEWEPEDPAEVLSEPVGADAKGEEKAGGSASMSDFASYKKEVQEAKSDIVESDILGLLGVRPPPPGRACPRAMKPLLRHRENTRSVLVPCLPCKSWTCSVCRQRLQYSRGLHYAEKLLKTEKPLFVLDCLESRWEAIHRRIKRAKASYIGVKNAPGMRRIILTTALPDSIAASGEDACRLLGEALRAISRMPFTGKRARFVDSSKDWKLPSREPGKWARIGRVTCSNPEPILKLLHDQGIEADVADGDGGEGAEWIVQWNFPEDWSESRIGDVLEQITALETATASGRPANVCDWLARLDDELEGMMGAA